jgi:hypothetical protein
MLARHVKRWQYLTACRALTMRRLSDVAFQRPSKEHVCLCMAVWHDGARHANKWTRKLSMGLRWMHLGYAVVKGHLQ